MRVAELPGKVTGFAAHIVARVPQSLRRAVTSFNDQRGAEAAAALAYYAFLSLFPLLVFLVAAASLLLRQEDVYTQLRILLRDVFPLPSQLLARNLDEVLSLSAPVGIIALITLLWSGIGFFSALSYNLTRAWPDARLRTLLGHRVMGLKIAFVLLVLLIVSVALSLSASLLPAHLADRPKRRADDQLAAVANSVQPAALVRQLSPVPRALPVGAQHPSPLAGGISWRAHRLDCVAVGDRGFQLVPGQRAGAVRGDLRVVGRGGGAALLGVPEQHDRHLLRPPDLGDRHDTRATGGRGAGGAEGNRAVGGPPTCAVLWPA